MRRAPSLKFLIAHPAHFLALGFGAGLSPVAPGTMGTLLALPLAAVVPPPGPRRGVDPEHRVLEARHQDEATRDGRAREKDLAATVQGLEQRVAAADQRDAAARKREQELLAQIKTLQQQIEQLQKLDLEMEKRRRSVR